MVVRQWRLVQSTNTLVFLVVKKVQASVEQVIKQLANLVVMAFSSLARTFGEGLTVLPVLFFFFFKVEISSCTPIPLFKPGSVHSGSAS